jgi:hypothetical protein
MCVQMESAMRLQKLFYYIRHAKINYKVFFPYYTIKNTYIGCLFVIYVYFGARQAVADEYFFTTIIWKNYKFGNILVEVN